MRQRKWIGMVTLLACTLVYSGNAFAEGQIQKYLNNAAQQAQAVNDPAQKRAILDDQYRRLADGMQTLSGSAAVSANDRAALKQESALLNDKRDELAGRNGYARVPNDRIDQFATYVVQDMEQADTVITMSVVTFLLLLILVVLIAR